MTPRVVRVAAGLCLCLCLLLVMHALVLGFYFEATPQALADAAKGKAVGCPAALGAVAAVAALVRSRRSWARVAVAVAALLAVAALVVDVVR